MAKNTEHGIYSNEINEPNPMFPKVKSSQTLTCWCGEKFTGSYPNNKLADQMDAHVANPPAGPDPGSSQTASSAPDKDKSPKP